jgi:hypothetical protein
MNTATHEQHVCSIYLRGDSAPFMVAASYPRVLPLWNAVRVAQAEQPETPIAFVVPVVLGPDEEAHIGEAALLVDAIAGVSDLVLREEGRDAILDAILTAHRDRPALFEGVGGPS